jgi:hypothetical protein
VIRRSAWSLIEVLMVSAILGVSLTVMFSGFQVNSEARIRHDVRVVGRLLAQSIMESVGHRLNINDRRFFKLDTSQEELLEGIARGAWKRPFRAVEQARVAVVSADGRPGGWVFDAPDGPVLPPAVSSGPERAFYTRFSYEVRVGFDVQLRAGGPAVPIDADGDGRPEIDLARVDVEVFWEPERPGGEARSLCRLTSLFSYPDKPPGLGEASREAGP